MFVKKSRDIKYSRKGLHNLLFSSNLPIGIAITDT